jgi:periplasmic divalent cation tolerance protein
LRATFTIGSAFQKLSLLRCTIPQERNLFAKFTQEEAQGHMTDYRIVLTTTGSADEAERIATALVEAQLAACVNIVSPIKSVYRWKGSVQKEREWLLLIKTTSSAFENVSEKISELHSYDLPECIQIPVEAGSAEYLDWIRENVKDDRERLK